MTLSTASATLISVFLPEYIHSPSVTNHNHGIHTYIYRGVQSEIDVDIEFFFPSFSFSSSPYSFRLFFFMNYSSYYGTLSLGYMKTFYPGILPVVWENVDVMESECCLKTNDDFSIFVYMCVNVYAENDD